MRSRVYHQTVNCILLLSIVSMIMVSCSDDKNPVKSSRPVGVVNQEILFLSDRLGADQIFVMDTDGENLLRMATDAAIYESPSWSPDGQSILCAQQIAGQWDICLIKGYDRSQTLLASNEADDRYPVWSPDGSKIAFESWRDGDREIYVMNADGSNLTRVTNHVGEDKFPSWYPDGTALTFVSRDAALGALWSTFWVNVDGTDLIEPTLNNVSGGFGAWSSDGIQFMYCNPDNSMISVVDTSTLATWALVVFGEIKYQTWSPDGERILLSVPSPSYQIWDWEQPTVQSFNFHYLASNAFNNTEPFWKPDMTEIVFCSDRDGNKEIYVMNADGSGQINLSNDGATDWSPHWRNVQ